MMGKSHLLIGLACGTLFAAVTNATATDTGLMIAAAGLGSMLPDIDHRHAPLRQKLGFIGDVLLFWLPHRGLTHSLLVLVTVFLVAAMIAGAFGLSLALGYASHILADLTTQRGLPLLYPAKLNCYLLPRGFRVTTGTWSEMVVLLIVLFVLGAAIARMHNLALPQWVVEYARTLLR